MVAPESKSLRILGIDPGSLVTGFALVDVGATDIRFVQQGVIVLKDLASLSARLSELHRYVGGIVSKYVPQQVVLEKIFLKNNPQSVFVLGQARGVILSVVGAHALPLHEYSPREVKKSVTGAGQASKEQVARALTMRLGLKTSGDLYWDSFDALALAFHHALILQSQMRGVRRSL